MGAALWRARLWGVVAADLVSVGVLGTAALVLLMGEICHVVMDTRMHRPQEITQ